MYILVIMHGNKRNVAITIAVYKMYITKFWSLSAGSGTYNIIDKCNVPPEKRSGDNTYRSCMVSAAEYLVIIR